MLCLASAASAQSPKRGEVPPPSSMDALMFYDVMRGEMELVNGQFAEAYRIMLGAARRTREPQLFQRAIDIAVQGRAAEEALAAARAWRSAVPGSADAARMEVQLLGALNRLGEAADALRALIQLTPAAERGGLLASLPRAMQRAPDRRQAAAVMHELLQPYTAQAELRVPALVAQGRGWLLADDTARALALAEQAQSVDVTALGPALLGLELMARMPKAESLVRKHLATGKAELPVRMAYVRSLASVQRVADAIGQLQMITRDQPQYAPAWLTLGALELDLRHFVQADAALQRYLELQPKLAISAPAATTARDDDDDDEAAAASGLGDSEAGAIDAWLLLARSAEQRGNFAAAEAWLAKIDDPRRALEVQTRRATILARQGKLGEARAVIQATPERSPDDARAKLLAEVGVLREVQRWQEAYDLLGSANQRFAADPDLLYEQAMMAEKARRFDDGERLLRKVIELKPDNAHAYNALGYSLADRNQRLPEARQLVAKALELMPGDPFITDSLGWIEFRMGNVAEAIRLLRQAYTTRPDAEIAAHLGEALWVAGQRDEAREVWRRGKQRDEANEVLRETLARLQVKL